MLRLSARVFHHPFMRWNSKLVPIHFIKENSKERITVNARVGGSIYDAVLDNDIDLDGFGACEATMACVTCHVIFDSKTFKRLKSSATDDEEDMLDLATSLTDTSRLGCQVEIEDWMSNIEITVPSDSVDIRSYDS